MTLRPMARSRGRAVEGPEPRDVHRLPGEIPGRAVRRVRRVQLQVPEALELQVRHMWEPRHAVPLLLHAWRRLQLRRLPGLLGAWLHRRFVPPLIRFIPDSLTYSVPLLLK
jgi:hypothetical protein